MPRTGNKAWAASFEKIISTWYGSQLSYSRSGGTIPDHISLQIAACSYRVANYRDPIPTLPGSIRFKHCGNLVLVGLRSICAILGLSYE